ncbi:MAG: O-antigen ligase family protein [Planctomycetaceae bacterium]|nr:O-antigen ligase family protein [Planctomycetaceae bacterium]
MNAARKSTSAARTRGPAVQAARPQLPWWELLLVTLLLVRCFVPAEGTDRGLTLWLAAASYGLFAVDMWRRWREQWRLSLRRPRLASVGVGLLVGGHLISAAWATFRGGDVRAILNYAWEWGSVAALAVSVGGVMQSASFRRLVLTAILTTGGLLAGLGCWQHFVWYPRIAATADRLAVLESSGRTTEAEQREYERLLTQIPEWNSTSETGRKLLHARMANSQEPIGAFALANTFAGFLLLPLLLGWDIVVGARRLRGRLVLVAVLVGIAYCLLLTKGRTAYLGGLVGIVLWGLLRLRRGGATGARVSSGLLVAGGLVVVGVGLAIVTGSLDVQVLSESSKSLRYRIEYWSATLSLLRDHPLLGCGPGSFRQVYQQYKLPGSSEEILDPHNFVLDVWANGGLLALVGMGLIVAGGAHSLFRAVRKDPTPEDSTTTTDVIAQPTWFHALCGGLPPLVALAGRLAFEGWFDPTLALLVPGGMLLATLLWQSPVTPSATGWLVAWGAIVTHLLGAGGIGMPAILQLVLLVWGLGCVEEDSSSETNTAQAAHPEPAATTGRPTWSSAASDRVWLSGIGTGLIALLGCLWTGVIPVIAVQESLTAARAMQSRNERQAQTLLELAATQDSLSPEPWQELALLHMGRYRRSPRWNEADFTAGIEAQLAAIRRDPLAGKRTHLLGQSWAVRFEQTQEQADAQSGIEAFQAGLKQYPTFVPLHADLAELLAAAGQSARDEARQALRLNELNRAAGHIDKLLPEDQAQRLRQLADAVDADPNE